jgi:hypothetical protein
MSTYGLRVKDAAGNIILDTSHTVARIRYSAVIASGVSSSITLSDILGKTTYAFSIPLEMTGAYGSLAHDVAISGTTFSWTAKSDAYHSSASSLVGVIIVD